MTAGDRKPEYRIGTASWTDPTLLATGFYPRSAKTAESRLRVYAEHFNTVEVDSTYYAVPSERNAALWATRTPDSFQFNIKAFALLTQHAAETRALPQALKELLPSTLRRAPRVSHPPSELLELSFEMFRTALEPLRAAGKLGCVLFQFPPWFTARDDNEAYIDSCCTRMRGCQLAIEFRHPSWFNGRGQRTLDFLCARQLSLVCVDAPSAPSVLHPPYATTSAIAYVRLHGRNRESWFRRTGTAAQRFKYLYSDDELQACAAKIRGLAGAGTVYVVFNNCYGDYGVRNALTMQQLLNAGET